MSSSDPKVIAETPLAHFPRVKITGREHPHRGEYGRFTGQTLTIPGSSRKMALVKLEACKHGTDGCYVSPGDVREVNDNDQYV